MRTNQIPDGYFTVSNTDGVRGWDGPGIENDQRPWLNRTDIGDGTGFDEVANYLDDDGPASDWFIRWPDGRVERLTYDGTSCGFVDEGDSEDEEVLS